MKSTEKNRQLSVATSVKIDDAISENGFIVNEAINTIHLTLHNLGEDLTRCSDLVRKIGDIGVTLQKIGGSLPYNLRAVFAGCDPLDPEMTEGGFVKKLNEIVKINNDPIQLALAFGSLAKKITFEITKVNHRIEKLNERTRMQKHGPEYEIAKRMKQTARDTVAVLDKRLEFVLDYFFIARNKAIDALVLVNEAVYHLFPDGSSILRSSYLNNQTSSLDTFKRIDDCFGRGYHTSVRKTVKI